MLTLLLGSAPATAVELAVEINGIEDELREAARANLAVARYVGRDASRAGIADAFAEAEMQVRRALEPYGYYSSEVTSALVPKENSLVARFDVSKGPPTLVQEADVSVEGPGGDDESVREAVEAFTPKPGDRLVHATYEDSKAAIASALRSRGYLNAEPTQHRVRVHPDENSAQIQLRWRSGPRFQFGDVTFSGGQFREAFLQRFVPWEKENASFSTDRLLTLQERLIQSGYFASVLVEPKYAEASDLKVPVEVRVLPDKRNAYRISAFYGTDSGAGLNALYERRWVNSHGHKLLADIDYSQRLQDFTVTYRMPRGGPEDLSENFGIAWRSEDTDTARSRGSRIVANRSRLWRGFQRTLGMQFLRDRFEIGGDSRTSHFLYPQVALARSRTDDWQFPTEGYSLAMVARAAREGLLSDASFAQARIDARWIRAFGEHDRLLLSSSLGATAVNDFTRLPPDLRFFAGGDRSIRGFDYESVGAQDSNGEVIGGKHLAVASVEYEHYFTESWGAAVFTDAGDAFAGDSFDLHAGAGIGIRWRSPLGVVRVDVAKPITPEPVDGIRVHVIIGPDL